MPHHLFVFSVHCRIEDLYDTPRENTFLVVRTTPEGAEQVRKLGNRLGTHLYTRTELGELTLNEVRALLTLPEELAQFELDLKRGLSDGTIYTLTYSQEVP